MKEDSVLAKGYGFLIEQDNVLKVLCLGQQRTYLSDWNTVKANEVFISWTFNKSSLAVLPFLKDEHGIDVRTYNFDPCPMTLFKNHETGECYIIISPI